MKLGLSALRRLWPAAPVALLGVVIGVIGWGGFNTAMEATNSLGFCVSCHEMRDNVYEEYKKTVHYRNKSGVRAICSDCHVPHDWTHKVIRKVQATKELYHWALGTIDTKEKFEAKRHELARHEWDRMRANDSRECRNCHSYEAMDFHKQDAKAASAMTAAMKAGKTCIDCHKGIAHTFPDITAGHRAASARLAEAAKGLAPAVGATLYAIGPTPLYLDKPGADEADGDIAPATAIRCWASKAISCRSRLSDGIAKSCRRRSISDSESESRRQSCPRQRRRKSKRLKRWPIPTPISPGCAPALSAGHRQDISRPGSSRCGISAPGSTTTTVPSATRPACPTAPRRTNGSAISTP